MITAEPTKPQTARARLGVAEGRDMAELEGYEQLSPSELGELGEQLANTQDKAEVLRLKEAMIRGFYGTK